MIQPTLQRSNSLKYRYLRALDTKHWDDFTDTLAEDVTGDYGSSVGIGSHFTTAPTWSTTCQALGPGAITEHRVTPSEQINVTGDT